MTDEIRPALTPEEWKAKPAECYIEIGSVGAVWETTEIMLGRDVSDGDLPPDRASDFDAPLELWRDVDASLHLNIGTAYLCNIEERHALAALCLYNQPFGFTHEDVAILIDVLAFIHGMDSACDENVREIADKIAALLPPP